MIYEFIRGDTFAFKVPIKLANKDILPQNSIETLFITVRKTCSKGSKILFQKRLDDVEIDNEGYCHVKFNSEDTEELEYGSYFFDIEVTTISGYRKTRLYEFKITEETTMHGSGELSGN